ncbi:pentatricopeptide repeat-containing protein mitochondrial [Dorcoceras hygrometricum]|uniref:Pentatricopeptide repeat-containing protein mitochondrial n=1 Tax=Dorcoceras hygrometricum TaxID=472368 RepID=A0A2Z7BS15_9LAMI|nr:pentatricopeptide repeat-containing protein mitochondrial [Dorcoceras hygrometricum]
MSLKSLSAKRRNIFVKGFHLGNHFTSPIAEDIIFKAVCVNVQRKKWNFVDQLSSTLTNSLIYRVLREFRRSPNIVLEFHQRIRAGECLLDSLGSCCILIHAMVDRRNFDNALCLMKKLMVSKGYYPLEISESLVDSYDACFSSTAVFDALIRTCTELGAIEEAYVVIEKLRTRGYWISVHAWNNFLNHLLKTDEVGRFWIVYNEMISYGYCENLNTLNLIIYAHCIQGDFSKAFTVLYRMLKRGISPNVISFNMLIDGACRAFDLTLAHELVKKMGDISRGCVSPNVVSYNCLINGYCKLGKMDCAKEILVEMVRLEVEPNVRTYATMIDGYARHGYLKEAFELCDIIVEEGLILDSVIYNSLIHWIYVQGYVSVGSLLLSNMMENYTSPDHFTHSIVSKELCRNGHVTEALKFHGWALDKNLVKDSFPYNILINYLCRSNDISGAKQLLCSMFVRGFIPNLVTYATMIDGYCKAGWMGIAGTRYPDMVEMEKDSHDLCKEGL